MNKEFSIAVACVILAGAGWLGTSFYQKQQAAEVARVEQARKSGYAKAMEDARAAVKKVDAARTQDAADGGLTTTSAGGAQKPAAPAPAPEVQSFLASAKITAVMLGDPSIVVINKKEYEPGGEIALANGRRLRVQTIADEAITFSDGARSYRVERR